MKTRSQVRRVERSRRKAALLRLRDWYVNTMNATRRAADRQFGKDRMSTEDAERAAIINRMTNWQRNHWGRAGHPGELNKLRQFASLPHWRKAPIVIVEEETFWHG